MTGSPWYLALPHLNACLNSACSVLLFFGYLAIRRKESARHARLMLAAFGVSSAFLASYLTYHYLAGSKKFDGEGALRTVYFTILITHTVLAVVALPLVLTTLTFALRRRIESHRRIARITLPVWFYVSVTGVVVYLLLYIVPH